MLVLVAILACAAGVAVAMLTDEPGDVSNPDVAFRADEDPQTAPAEQTGRPHRDFFTWPVYGGNFERTHYLPLKQPLRPPYTVLWKHNAKVLLEFPPVAGRRDLFILKDNGVLVALDRFKGRVKWKKRFGRLAASSPAYANGTIYIVILERGHGIRAGRVAAVSAKNGRTKWSRKLPSRAESSPIYTRGVLYFGTEGGTFYALRARDGAVKWTYNAGGAIKGGPALADGKLYFGTYGGHVHAIRADNGRRVWRADSASRGLRGTGNFYSTPSVAYGRVYIGNTDGYVYSFATDNGSLAWRKGTGGYVYSSPAVANSTVFVGSYDHHLYALDARSGRQKWARDTGARVSGGLAIIGDMVFVSNLEHRTIAYGVNTGRKVWQIDKGLFNPGISDGKRFYFVSSQSLYAMKPRSNTPEARKARRESAARRKREERVNKRIAQRKRYLKYRFGLHGHRHHVGRNGKVPHCHKHRHVYFVGHKRIVLVHNHCHRHTWEVKRSKNKPKNR